MKTNEAQKELGQRLTQMRKRKGLSQEELSARVQLSRPSLAQIELGNRGVNIQEFQRFAEVLEFSLDDFVSKDFHLSAKESLEDDQGIQQSQERISVPKLQVAKFKQVLLYILERCGGKPNVGETVLYKLLYFSDFNYYELYEEQLTGAKYRKLPYGPVPQKLDIIIEQMRADGQLERIKTNYHGYPQTRYFPLIHVIRF
ncbi:MAG: helix-turn-helix domain-containing protein [Flavobacteriales bacterium]